MGLFINNCRRIAEELNCLVLVIHHSGKDARQGARGHSSFLAAVDTMLNINDGIIRLEKQKDGEGGLEWGYDLKKVILSFSKEREISGVVAIPAGVSSKKARPLAKNPAMLLELINEMMSLDMPDVAEATAKAEFSRRHEGTARAASQGFKRALKTLCDDGYISQTGNKIRLMDDL